MSRLFTPIDLGPLSLPNRIAVAPMCQYSAIDGLPQPWHDQHIGRLATSGAGLVVIEATGVEAAGRISWADTGLWNDDQEQAFARILAGVRTYSDTPIGVQLAHAGRKASTNPPWIERGGPAPADKAWETFAPSPIAFADGWHTPTQLDEAGMERVVQAFVDAARRAERAGFDLVELHAAHGYLLSEFLSPLANQRTDAYGGSPENCMRFPLRVAQALRDAWPKALGVRFNGSDWVQGGIAIEEVQDFARALHAVGYDYLHVSSGGNAARADIPGGELGYQLRFAEAVKQAVPDAVVMAVGMIVTPHQAEDIVARGQADMIAIARAVLDDANWGAHAAVALGAEPRLPIQYGRAAPRAWPGYGAVHRAEKGGDTNL